MRTLAEAVQLRDGLSAHSWASFVAIHKSAARSKGRLVESLRELAAGTGSGTRTVPLLLAQLARHGLVDFTVSGTEVSITVR